MERGVACPRPPIADEALTAAEDAAFYACQAVAAAVRVAAAAAPGSHETYAALQIQRVSLLYKNMYIYT